MSAIPVIVKWEGGRVLGNPVLFFPEAAATSGRIVCYAHVGQHSEADMAYYRSLKNPLTPRQRERAAVLIRGYKKAYLGSGETLKPVRKDTARYRKQRYGWINDVGCKDSPMETV